MKLLHDYPRGRFPHYGVGETAAIGAGTAAAATTAATTATTAATAATSFAAGAGTLGANLGAAAIPTILGSSGSTIAASAGLASVLSPTAVTALSALQSIGGGLLTGIKTALPLASAGSSIKSGVDASKANKVAAKQERRRSEAAASQSLSRARSVLAANDVAAAARGVVGGSGSQVALQGSNIRTAGAEMADIESDGNNRQALASYARKRVMTKRFAQAATPLLDSFFKSTDYIGG